MTDRMTFRTFPTAFKLAAIKRLEAGEHLELTNLTDPMLHPSMLCAEVPVSDTRAPLSAVQDRLPAR
jgi:hypothetical protein